MALVPQGFQGSSGVAGERHENRRNHCNRLADPAAGHGPCRKGSHTELSEVSSKGGNLFSVTHEDMIAARQFPRGPPEALSR